MTFGFIQMVIDAYLGLSTIPNQYTWLVSNASRAINLSSSQNARVSPRNQKGASTKDAARNEFWVRPVLDLLAVGEAEGSVAVVPQDIRLDLLQVEDPQHRMVGWWVGGRVGW